MKNKKWNLHICTPWECGYGNAIWRINLKTPKGFLILALEPGSTVVRRKKSALPYIGIYNPDDYESVWIDWTPNNGE